MCSGKAAGERVVLVAVGDPDRDVRPLLASIDEHLAGWAVRGVWSGDPQLRPTGELRWIDTEAMGGSAWERQLVWADRQRAMCSAIAASVPKSLDDGASVVLVLEAGAVALVGDLAEWLDPPPVARFSARVDAPPLDDARAPSAADLVATGSVGASIALFGAGSRPLLQWLEAGLRAPDGMTAGRWLTSAASAFGADVRLDARVGAGPWRWPANGDVALVDAPHYDAERPWVLDTELDRPARIELVGWPERQAVMARAAGQLGGQPSPLVLPGGIVADATIRELVASNPDCPPPWSEAAAFRRWLEARYWFALHARRRDLAAAFPEPIVADRRRFDAWCAEAFAIDAVPFLVRHRPAGTSSIRVERPLRSGGLNLVGYLGRESSLGDVGRRLLGSMRAADVPVTTIGYERTGSPAIPGMGPFDQELRFDTTLAIVNADQFPALRMDHPELFSAGGRTIGYWFWELSTVTRPMLPALDLVDEIWAGSQFVADAFASVADVPVRRVPIPVPEPATSGRRRGDFDRLRGFDDRFVFAVAFDHFSVTERKNPIGAIRAFQRAFAPGEGPVLLIKSMNAANRWVHHAKVVAAAEGRPDIVFWDERLERDDQMALVAAADCLVSLHRSEGLGLHLAEAMWLGTPTIATRYSGNLDFMDDGCSMLVDASMVHVTDGQGIFPSSAMWADPDLDQAAAAMRAMVDDPARRAVLAAAAVERMRRQPSLAETGRQIAALLRST